MLRIAIGLFLFAASAFAQHSNALTWSWSQGVGDPATGFHVWRSATTPVPTTGAPYAVVASPSTLTYVDSSVSAGQSWSYVVTAYSTGAVTALNPGGDSLPSNTFTCVTPFSAPPPPTGLSGLTK